MNNKAVIGSYNVKNYADLHNSSYHAKAESNN